MNAKLTDTSDNLIPSDVVADFTVASLDAVRWLGNGLRQRCRALVQGRDEVIDLILCALFADGHLLLEDHPGSGKTTLAKALGESIVRGSWDRQIAPFRR